MMRRMAVASWFLRVTISLVVMSIGASASARPLRIDDQFKLTQLPFWFRPNADFSPNGQSVAFQIGRAEDSQNTFASGEVATGGLGNGDIWVQLRPGDKAFNITGNQRDAGWNLPRWSPDGRSLAFVKFSLEGESLWVWSAATKRLRRVPCGAVYTFSWVDAHRIVAEVWPANSRNVTDRILGTPDTEIIAPNAWSAAKRGRVATASALVSEKTEGAKSPASLVLVDTTSAAFRPLVQNVESASWDVSPSHDAVMYIVRCRNKTQSPEARTYTGAAEYGIGVVDLDGKKIFSSQINTESVLPLSRRWAGDGSEIAFLTSPGTTGPATLHRFNLHSSKESSTSLDGIYDATSSTGGAKGLEWVGEARWLVLGRGLGQDSKSDARSRSDWWLVTDDGLDHRAITANMTEPPLALVRQSGGRGFVGISRGQLWRLDLSQRSAVRVMSDYAAATISRIEWPNALDARLNPGTASSGSYDHIVVATASQAGHSVYEMVDLTSGAARALESPDPDALVGKFSPTATDAIFYLDNGMGSRVWRKGLRGKSVDQELLSKNRFLRDIPQGGLQMIDYSSQDGAPLHGYLLLPPDFRPGRQYPLVVWVYDGVVYDAESIKNLAESNSVASVSQFNMQLLASHGYAVLFPSMPQSPDEDKLLSDLPRGVIPAIDEAVSMGVADPSRVVVMGHSFGGFSAAGLIGQTDRFKAAVILNGIYDWLSDFGTYDARFRYSDDAAGWALDAQSLVEAGQAHLGEPPWKNFKRYLENSPISLVDHMNTPTLLVSGDMDFVPIQQAEELFSGLDRRQVPSEFVRYWGEGHVLRSPANIKDFWSRTFAWFDRYADICRGPSGDILFDGSRARSRSGAPAWAARDFLLSPTFFTQGTGESLPPHTALLCAS